MDASQNYQLSLIQGATFIRTFTWFDPSGDVIDLTGYSADMMFRSTVEDTGTPIIEASTVNGLIVINGPAGAVTVTIPSSSTSALTNDQAMAYSLFLTSGTGIVTSLIAGPAVVQGSTVR